MLVTDVREKVRIFMDERGLTQRDIAREFGVSFYYFSNMMVRKVPMSARIHTEIENMFKRYGFTRGLDDKGRL